MKEQMVCERCEGQQMTRRKATTTNPYRYALSGLSNVYLAGIDVLICPRCGGESPRIPRLDELHRQIALRLFHKPGALRGEEIRYLRKHAGLSAVKMAAILGVRPEHLSRAENDRIALGETTERFVRALSIMAMSDDKASDFFGKMTMERSATKVRTRTILVTDGRGWKAAA